MVTSEQYLSVVFSIVVFLRFARSSECAGALVPANLPVAAGARVDVHLFHRKNG